MITKNGSLLLFRLFGVNVYVNWTWLIGAIVMIWWDHSSGEFPSRHPASLQYSILMYLSLFVIVLIHEFGHALACKSVGGRADQIVLMPLGGVAYVQPPQRAGAYLWSIAAGPLVNVVLLPLTIGPALLLWSVAPGTTASSYMVDLAVVNAMLLVFNMLPFYPLDGGQILRSLIWFAAGRSLSLLIATSVGLVGAVLLGLLALWAGGIYLGVMVFFMGSICWRSFRAAREMYKVEKAPRRMEAACPRCGEHPPLAPLWRCTCGATFDMFESGAVCPNCRRGFETLSCPLCGESTPTAKWYPEGAHAVAGLPEQSPPWSPS